jgi:FkbM family methyltransferase
MWVKLNLLLRKHTPRFHAFFKKATLRLRNSEVYALPIPVYTGSELFLLHPYFLTHDQTEPHVQSYFRSVLRRGDVVLDIGANFGFHTMLLSRLVGSTGRVIAFEPSPENLKLLRYHCRTNLMQNVQICTNAVGDVANSSVDFVLIDGGKHSSNSFTVADESPYILEQQKTVIRVPMTTIDITCKKSNVKPTLIKIDVEGAEFFVLKGAEQTITKYRPSIVIGIHPFWMPKYQSTGDIIQFLRTHNYEIKNFDGCLVDELKYGDYIATPR